MKTKKENILKYFVTLLSMMLLLNVMTACNVLMCDGNIHSYYYYFNVEGGNGEIYYVDYYGNLDTNSSPITLKGVNKRIDTLKFIAEPNEGYQVKYWKYNGEIIEGNKTNHLEMQTHLDKNNNKCYFTVEFEPIQ